MDEWNRHEGLNGPFGIISIQNSSFRRLTKFFVPDYEDGTDDSQFLEKKMTLEKTIDGIPVRKLFVANIPIETENKELFNVFKKFGEIANVFIQRKNKNVHKRSTFGFVTYKTTEDAARAMDYKKFSIRFNNLFVRAADSWHQPLVNPDGTVEYKSSLIYNKNIEKKNETDNCNVSEGEDTDDDIVGAVGGITISCVSSQEAKLCPISRLNDDCLEQIFSYLPLHCQITASNVCKRWQTVVSNMLRKIESFNFQDHFANRKFDMSEISLILEKIGPNLKEIICNPENEFTFSDKSLISVVARYCTKLEVLEVAFVQIAKRSFTFLSKRCPNLRKVTFYACSQLTDYDLGFLLGKKDSKLEEINLIKLTDICGECFTSLQPPLNHITIDGCFYVKPEFLILGMTHVKDTLTSLTLRNCMSNHCFDINQIASIVPKLKFLNMSDIFPLSPNYTLEPLGKFTELQSLNLSNNGLVSDSIISIIANGCKMLKSLNLSVTARYGLLSEKGIAELCNMHTLEELNVSRLELVNDETMKNFSMVSPAPLIKKLICYNCKNLSDKGALSVLSACKELEYFDLRSCPLIKNETISKALSVVKKRQNNLPLKIMIYGTDVSFTGTDESSYYHPLLTLDFTDDSDMNNVLDHLLEVCGNGNYFCDGIDCQCCVGFEDDDDDFLTDSNEDVDDFLFDIDDDYIDSDFDFDDDDDAFPFF